MLVWLHQAQQITMEFSSRMDIAGVCKHSLPLSTVWYNNNNITISSRQCRRSEAIWMQHTTQLVRYWLEVAKRQRSLKSQLTGAWRWSARNWLQWASRTGETLRQPTIWLKIKRMWTTITTMSSVTWTSIRRNQPPRRGPLIWTWTSVRRRSPAYPTQWKQPRIRLTTALPSPGSTKATHQSNKV